MLDEHWRAKKLGYDIAGANGALGGKISGAGGGAAGIDASP